MSITELAIHNVLRTYSRQDRLGKLQRARSGASAQASDKLDLSSKAQKLAVFGRAAEEYVSTSDPSLTGVERDAEVRRVMASLIQRHTVALDDKSVTPESLEEALKTASPVK